MGGMLHNSRSYVRIVQWSLYSLYRRGRQRLDWSSIPGCLRVLRGLTFTKRIRRPRQELRTRFVQLCNLWFHRSARCRLLAGILSTVYLLRSSFLSEQGPSRWVNMVKKVSNVHQPHPCQRLQGQQEEAVGKVTQARRKGIFIHFLFQMLSFILFTT